MKRILTLALLASLSSSATADESEGQAFGIGMDSCAEFVKNYGAQPALVENTYYIWAEGFWSGMNLHATAASQPARRLASIDMRSAKVEIRAYCDRHPLMPYYDALLPIYLKLPTLPK